MDELLLRAWVASIPGVGPKRFADLTAMLPSLSALLTFTEHELISCGVPQRLAWSALQHRISHPPTKIREWCHEQNVQIILPPQLLSQIPDPPIVLYCKGRLPDESLPHIAVVGTRKVTPYGMHVTEMLTRQLVAYGCVIVSGFMYGVDRIAHQTAMTHGGKTIGVLGFGFDYMYPSEHKALAEEMVESGNCLLTEFPPWQPPRPENFPRRNRIVSGLSLGVLVTEAAKKSGTLITASCALEQGREVFAVPGPIDSPFSEGTKDLINMGAKLTTEAKDIIEELAIQIVSNRA